MLRTSIILTFALSLAAGCGKKKDCEAYAKKVAALPSSAGPSMNKSDSGYDLLLQACKDGISDQEYDCAMQVATTEELFSCISKKK